MADGKDKSVTPGNPGLPPEEQVLDLEPVTEQVFLEVLVSGDKARVRELKGELHPSDAADLLERLSPDDRGRERVDDG